VTGTGRRSCEIIPEKAKTSHAKAPRRRGAKKTKQLFFAIFAIFAPLRETVYFFTASDARATVGAIPSGGRALAADDFCTFDRDQAQLARAAGLRVLGV
jgi:hypothetical protein